MTLPSSREPWPCPQKEEYIYCSHSVLEDIDQLADLVLLIALVLVFCGFTWNMHF